jgi:VWFA-related protein
MRLPHVFVAAITVTLAFAAFTLSAPAQSTAPPTDDPHPYTLHVYTNLVQVPTLILDEEGKPIPHLTRTQVEISLDRGAPFSPTAMRVEGNDPLALAILFDASGAQRPVLQSFPADFSALASQAIHPGDRLAMYAVDCTLVRAASSLQPTAESVKAETEQVLNSPLLHGGKAKPACSNNLKLYDAVAQVVAELATLPGRRVLVIISEGRDGRSVTPLSKLINYAGVNGVAIFGIRDFRAHQSEREFDSAVIGGLSGDSKFAVDSVSALAHNNGGIVFNVEPLQLGQDLNDLLTDIRARYILEFSWPHNQAGLHGISVTVPDVDASARPAGVSTSLPDPAVYSDPTTIPTADSPAVIGTHRPKTP